MFFIEHYYALERNSFFAFNTHFLNSFFSLSPRPNMFPGETHIPGFALLFTAFSFQFFKIGHFSWVTIVTTGLIFSFVFTAVAKKFVKTPLSITVTPLWAITYLFLAISPKFPTYFVYSILWAGVFFYLVSLIKKPLGSLIIAGLIGCCAVWLIGFIATIVFWVFYSLFFLIHFRPHLSWLPLFLLFAISLTLQPLVIGKVHAINTFQIYRSGFVKKWHKNGFHKEWSLYNIVKKTERLVMESNYMEALEIANSYWFAHPCPIEDLVTGKNSLYTQLSTQQIELRRYLAIYTKLALIGSHRLNDDFFYYYRIPELYNDALDHNIPYFSKAKIIFDRLMGNFIGVYSQSMNLMELSGLDYFLLTESIQAALVCEQYGLANKYIHLIESSIFYREKAKMYKKASLILQQSTCIGDVDQNVLHILSKIKKLRTFGPTSWLDQTGNTYIETFTLWKQNPSCLENLEYISMFHLLYKHLDDLVDDIDKYLTLTNQIPPDHLPRAWQEALLLLKHECSDKPLISSLSFIEKIKWDDKILEQWNLFCLARKKYVEGFITPIEITRYFGHTFFYNYYFSRFIETTLANTPIFVLTH